MTRLTYFDGTALLALLRTDNVIGDIVAAWESAEQVTSSAFAYVEVRSRLAEVRSLGRFSASLLFDAFHRFNSIWDQVATAPVTDAVLGRAGDLVPDHPIDLAAAIHLATAEAMLDDLASFVNGSDATRDAAALLDLPTLPPST